ncbi:hypothetical protein [Sphingomonas dokdonensis]|uniref:Uncharacterized protein n=1 Tax=Sphingomonas dokdonensis TaxID=344880 RepID=A0A245ZDT4_9SPHN|nr:hypothetical protein [Sphingomonas dokdonensis]OWK27888.1 hypothetical protein SPDO_29710 [Sphingomonas dokdonensis]
MNILTPDQQAFHPTTAQRRLDRYRALQAGLDATAVRGIATGASLDFDRADYALERLVKAQIEFAEAQLRATERHTAEEAIDPHEAPTRSHLSLNEAREASARSGNEAEDTSGDLDARSVRIACLRFATEHARGDAAIATAERMARFVLEGQVV